MAHTTQLAFVVPCFNEEEVLPATGTRIAALIARLSDAGKISPSSRIYFVDDGSSDGTWSVISDFVRSGLPVVGVKLSANRGQQNAVLAGLLAAEGHAIVSIDADLQDDLNALEQMIDRFHDGCDIVYGVRKSRVSDSMFKRLTAAFFYRFVAVIGVRLIRNHADCRLMSRRAVEALREFRESNLFLRGVVPLLGFRSCMVEYDRLPRTAGMSKYPLRKMFALAADGITSFSVVPLRLIGLIGLVVFASAMAVSAWVLWIKFFTDRALPGWTSIVLPMYFLGGVQLLATGIIGEYLARIYIETKARPRFIVEQIIGESPVAHREATLAAAADPTSAR
jgi:polyisoprenyl-phosphate glycosyltransferase